MDRRTFLAAGAAAGLLHGAVKKPIGLELYSVRKEFVKDMAATIKAVGKMGYDGVELFGSYADWTPAQTKECHKMIKDTGMKCYSTHTGAKYFGPEHLDRVIELNTILESKYIIMSSAGKVDGIDGWKKVAVLLNNASEKLVKLKKGTGFHNHAFEFVAIEGQKPIEVLAKETSKEVVLQLDVGTCIEAGTDPIAWIKANPGRIRSLHMKDWKRGLPNPHDGYKVLLGEGEANWKAIVNESIKTGGAEHLLVEQEGSRFSELETAQMCIDNFKKLMA
jgi:sugar phosphate isomerase/epimerase